MGRIISHEHIVKLKAPITLDWHELRVGDVAGRARALQSMVSEGMDVARVVAAAGLMRDE